MTDEANERQVWFLSCPKTDYCAIYFSSEDTEQGKVEIDTEHKDCRPKDHFIDQMHHADAVVLRQFWINEPRAYEPVHSYMARCWQAAAEDLEFWKLKSYYPIEPVGCWLNIRFASGDVQRLWFEYAGDPDEAPHCVLETLRDYGAIRLWTKDRRPVMIYQQAIGAIEVARWNDDREQ